MTATSKATAESDEPPAVPTLDDIVREGVDSSLNARDRGGARVVGTHLNQDRLQRPQRDDRRLGRFWGIGPAPRQVRARGKRIFVPLEREAHERILHIELVELRLRRGQIFRTQPAAPIGPNGSCAPVERVLKRLDRVPARGAARVFGFVKGARGRVRILLIRLRKRRRASGRRVDRRLETVDLFCKGILGRVDPVKNLVFQERLRFQGDRAAPCGDFAQDLQRVDDDRIAFRRPPFGDVHRLIERVGLVDKGSLARARKGVEIGQARLFETNDGAARKERDPLTFGARIELDGQFLLLFPVVELLCQAHVKLRVVLFVGNFCKEEERLRFDQIELFFKGQNGKLAKYRFRAVVVAKIAKTFRFEITRFKRARELTERFGNLPKILSRGAETRLILGRIGRKSARRLRLKSCQTDPRVEKEPLRKLERLESRPFGRPKRFHFCLRQFQGRVKIRLRLGISVPPFEQLAVARLFRRAFQVRGGERPVPAVDRKTRQAHVRFHRRRALRRLRKVLLKRLARLLRQRTARRRRRARPRVKRRRADLVTELGVELRGRRAARLQLLHVDERDVVVPSSFQRVQKGGPILRGERASNSAEKNARAKQNNAGNISGTARVKGANVTESAADRRQRRGRSRTTIISAHLKLSTYWAS
jgi:hypothetical protein